MGVLDTFIVYSQIEDLTMLQLFITSIRVAMPLMLAVAILIASRAYAPMERRTLARLTWGCAALGLIVGLVLAHLRLNSTMIDIPTLNMILEPPTFLAMLVFLVAVWVFGPRDLHDINQSRRHRFLTASALVSIVLSAAFFGFTYFFSTDGVVLMGSTLFETESILRLAGFILGSLLVLIACWGYVVCAERVPWIVRSVITSVVFLAIIVPRLVLLYQQLSTRHYLPQSNLVFDMVLWVQRNTAATFLVLAILIAIPGILAIWTHRRPAFDNLAQQRIFKAEQISRRRFLGLSLVGSAVFCWALTDGQARADYVPELSALEPIEIDGDYVYVTRELVDDDHLHRFGYQSQAGPEVRFIVIRKNEVAYGVGLDACEICGNAGYYEDKGKVICRECGVMMNIQTIGFAGGCNPIPIAYEVEPTRLSFEVAELESHASIFK